MNLGLAPHLQQMKNHVRANNRVSGTVMVMHQNWKRVFGMGSLNSGVRRLESWSTGVDEGENSSGVHHLWRFPAFHLQRRLRRLQEEEHSLALHPSLPHHMQWLCQIQKIVTQLTEPKGN